MDQLKSSNNFLLTSMETEEIETKLKMIQKRPENLVIPKRLKLFQDLC
jgi:hypothetical protein